MKFLSILTGIVVFASLANAQQIVTLTQNVAGTNSISIAEDQSVEILFMREQLLDVAAGGSSYLTVRKDGISTTFSAGDFGALSWGTQNSVETRYPVRVIFGGPVELELVSGNSDAQAMATLEITPGQYPPGKSAVIGERDGPMKCTLEESTDLVNWTDSTSGQTHSLTSANAKKFFRIKLERDVGP